MNWITNWFTASGLAAEAIVMLLLSGCLMNTTACTFHMHGSGESGLGYRSESKVFAYHHANEGNKAKAMSSTELSEPVTEWLFTPASKQTMVLEDGTVVEVAVPPTTKKTAIPKKAATDPP